MKTFVAVFTFICVLASNVDGQSTTLSPDEFEKGLSTPQVQVLDVRTAGEYQNGHIKNSLQADWKNPEQFKDRAQYLDKTRPVLVYCAAGGRSSEAAKYLRENGFVNVQELKGGLTAWRAVDKSVEGVPVVKQLTMDDYNQLLKSPGKVLVDFGAEWCPPCKKMEPVLASLQADLQNKFKLVKIDGGVQTDIMKQLNVSSLPVFIVYSNGREVWRKEGVADITELKAQLN